MSIPAVHPAAYLRRSYVDPDSPGDISRESQREAVRRLALADGHNGDLVEYDDWGVSADIAKSARRTEYARLLADMEAGKVSAVYAFDVDRLYRDPRDLIRLQDAASAHGVRIVTTGGPLAISDGDDPAAEGFAFIGAVFARMELQKAKKRAAAARAARIARGDEFGHAPFGFRHVREAGTGRIVREVDPSADVAPILAAYREAGTVLGACRILNERGPASPKGGRWHTSALTRVLEAHAPELLPRKGPSGKRIRPTRHASPLAQLVRCHCGGVMTPNTARRQLYCSRGTVTPGHGRYTVQAAPLLEWAKAEADRLRLPVDGIAAGDHEAERAALTERRERLAWIAADGLMSREQVAEEVARVDAALSDLGEPETVRDIPRAIDWDRWEPGRVNEALRALWRAVEVDPDMRPVRALWRRGEWRAA